MNRNLFGILLVLFVALGCAVAASAQRTTATFVGIVTDTTGAILPGAEAEILNEGTGAVMKQVSNEAGEFVSIGAPLVRVVQVDRIKVLVGIPERDVPHFKPGDDVSVGFDALPDRACSGRIFRIATTAEPATRTFITEIEVENSDRAIKPGMIARVALVRASFPEAITVPMFAVLSRSDGRFVFVERGGLAESRPVEVGFFQDGEVLITRGLDAGDRLIVVGHRTLRDGEPVRVASADR